MAPSRRKNADSSTATSPLVKTSRNQQQSTNTKICSVSSFGRVTKSARLNAQEKLSKYEKTALIEVVSTALDGSESEIEKLRKTLGRVPASKPQENNRPKRKRVEEPESDTETRTDGSLVLQDKTSEAVKKRKIFTSKKQQQQQPSPPSSRSGSPIHEKATVSHDETQSKSHASQLSQVCLDFISMHAAFLKALSLHFAHNGRSTPAELSGLMESTTRLWKKRTICAEDLRRMLGAYEVFTRPELVDVDQVERQTSPFEIVTSGLGLSVRTNIQYAGKSQFDEGVLQATYLDEMQRHSTLGHFTDGSPIFPLLKSQLGTQTSLHRAKAASTRAEILNLSASAQSRSTPDFSKLSISDFSEQTTASVKSRTLSLFDRIRAKGLESANNTAPTSQQILRRRAIGRIIEIVEFLRMKQQQKSLVQFHDAMDHAQGKVKGLAKVSFSLGAVVRDIRQSVGVPIGEEEVRLCLRMLSQEVSSDWCKIIELGAVTSLTLQGHGMSGVEVKRLLETKK